MAAGYAVGMPLVLPRKGPIAKWASNLLFVRVAKSPTGSEKEALIMIETQVGAPEDPTLLLWVFPRIY